MVFVLVSLAVGAFVQAVSAADRGRPLSASLTGAAEVPGPGDPDGSGTAAVTVNRGRGQICYTLTVEGIEPSTAAHIHVGTADVAGPVVVPSRPADARHVVGLRRGRPRARGRVSGTHRTTT